MPRKTHVRTPPSKKAHAADVAAGYERIVQRFLEWSQGRPDIRAAVIVGSRARRDHPADEWADLDVVVFADEPARYVDDAEWVREMGTPWITFTEATAVGNQRERRVLFEGGLDVDFALLPSAALSSAATSGLPAEFSDVVHRGYRILLDRDGAFAASPAPAAPHPSIPAQHEVLEAVNDFWYHAVWTAKHLRRGELWWAKGGCDGYMKELLRRMMEWHARTVRTPGQDTWMRGRFLEEWADPRAKRALERSFARYSEADVWHALLATMSLYRWLAQETLERLGIAYPAEADRHATALVKELYAGRTHGRRGHPARAAH